MYGYLCIYLANSFWAGIWAATNIKSMLYPDQMQVQKDLNTN